MGIITTRHFYATPIPAPEPERPNVRTRIARINGAKSRGPVTDEGKAKSSQNARKHGLTAKVFLVDPKDKNAFKRLMQGFMDALAPQNQVEDALVESIAQTVWNLKQSDNIETDMLRDNLEQGQTLHEAFSFDDESILRLSKYQSRHDRRLHKLFDQLRKLQADALDPKKNPVRLGRPSRHPMRFDDSEDREKTRHEKNQNEPTVLNLNRP